VELNNTYLSRGEVNGSEKWKQGKNTAINYFPNPLSKTGVPVQSLTK